MLTREQYVSLRRSKNLDGADLWRHYQETPHDNPKIQTYQEFEQWMAHYLQSNGNIQGYLRHYDHLYEIMYLNTPNISLVI